MINIEKIKERRRDKKIPQQKMASLLNVSQSSYSKYEEGLRRIPLETLKAISRILDVPLESISGEIEGKTSGSYLLSLRIASLSPEHQEALGKIIETLEEDENAKH